MKILITGVAGFIGSNLAEKLLENGDAVYGIDNLNDYYDVNLKKDRIKKLSSVKNFQFEKCDISDKEKVYNVFSNFKPEVVVHLAAQAGVRYSLINPDAYIESNIVGTFNILEASKEHNVDKLFYASSSSVYGNNKKVPFEESDIVDSPASLYAATKKSNELMASTYSHLYKMTCIGLRFFTVYGPMGRPDMAYFGFVDKFFNDESISIYNNGDFENDLYRDFTYIDDIVNGIILLINSNFENNHEVFNIGNNTPVKLMEFIITLERALSNSLGKKVEFNKKFEPIKPGDVPATYANTDKLSSLTGFSPSTELKIGLQRFTDWYVEYYGLGEVNNERV